MTAASVLTERDERHNDLTTDLDVAIRKQRALLEENFVDDPSQIDSRRFHFDGARLTQMHEILKEPFRLAQARIHVVHAPVDLVVQDPPVQSHQRTLELREGALQQHEVRVHVVRQGADQVVEFVACALGVHGDSLGSKRVPRQIVGGRKLSGAKPRDLANWGTAALCPRHPHR